MVEGLWRVDLFGRLHAHSERGSLNHLSMRRVGALLACLVLRAPHPIAREELVALLWPDEQMASARNRLRVLLCTLRRHLEPAGVEPDSVLEAVRSSVRIQPIAFTSDYHDFLQAIQAAKTASDDQDAINSLERALALYQGELLAGYYDEWILSERRLLADLRYRALRDLVRRLLQIDAPERAVDYARQAVAAEPLDEEAHCDLIRVCEAVGQPSAGLRQYEQLKRLLKDELQARPSEETRLLAARVEAKLGHSVTQTKRKVRPMALQAPEKAAVDQSYPDSLPSHLTRFFGRAEEIASLRVALAPAGTTRLVTLLGPGGMGKTRLAVEVASRLKEEYAGRVYFVALAEIVDPGHIGRAIARALRLPPAPDLDPLSQSMAALNQAPSLLVLDNMEQLLPDAGPLVECLLMEVTALRCLLTSRRSAGVEGEREVAPGPLPLPKEGDLLQDLSESPGVALFADRARSVRADFALTEQNAEDVVQLCRALEGLPLAIELAAARARVMSPGEMREQTGRLLNWLVDVRGGKTARHRSLRATLEWSHRLMALDERRLFSTLSVFAGGFTAEAAASVGIGEGTDTMDALAMLERLRAVSLLNVVEATGARTRFGMLETLREFGRERLVEMGSETKVRQRHLAYFATVARDWSERPLRWDAGELARVALEDENLREALEFGLRTEGSGDEMQFTVSLASALTGYWEIQGRWSEGRDYLRRALSLPETVETREVRVRALIGAGVLANLQGDYAEARLLSEEGLSLAQTIGNPSGTAGCLRNLGNVAFYLGDYHVAHARLQEALQMYRRICDLQGAAVCLGDLGNVAFYLGDHTEAHERLQEALDIYRQEGDLRGVAAMLSRLGNVLRNQSYFAEGRARLMEALELLQQMGSRQGVADCLHGLGLVARFMSDDAEAHLRFSEALKTFREIGNRRAVAACLLNLGSVAQNQGDEAVALSSYTEALEKAQKIGDLRNHASALVGLGSVAQRRNDRAAALLYYEEALAIEREIDNRGGIANCLAVICHLAIEMGDLGEARPRLFGALAIYHGMGVRSGVAEMVETYACLAWHEGDDRQAARFAGAAEMLREKMKFPRSAAMMLRHEKMLTGLRSTLSEETFTTAWRDGAQLSLPEAVSEALQQEDRRGSAS